MHDFRLAHDCGVVALARNERIATRREDDAAQRELFDCGRERCALGVDGILEQKVDAAGVCDDDDACLRIGVKVVADVVQKLASRAFAFCA